MKRNIMDEVGVLLLRHGFTVKTLTGSSFDIVARKESRVLLIKVLEDANSISEDYADSMKSLGSYIDASPVIIAEKAGHILEEGVVYMRFGVYTCNYNTFSSCLESRFPIVISTKAGFTASIIGDRLRRQREERGYSLGALSRKVGVSKRMISKYESNRADVSLRSAIALNRLFGSGIFNKVDVFAVAKETTSKNPSIIARKYDELGFRAADTKKAPFDVVAKLEKELILTEVSPKNGTNPQLESLQQLLGADALIIFDKKTGYGSNYQQNPNRWSTIGPSHKSDKVRLRIPPWAELHRKGDLGNKKKLPSMQKRDFLGMESAKELIRFLREFE